MSKNSFDRYDGRRFEMVARMVERRQRLAVFELLRTWPTNLSAVLCAFDLLELDGEDLRRLPIEVRKAGLVQLLLRKPSPGIAPQRALRRQR